MLNVDPVIFYIDDLRDDWKKAIGTDNEEQKEIPPDDGLTIREREMKKMRASYEGNNSEE